MQQIDTNQIPLSSAKKLAVNILTIKIGGGHYAALRALSEAIKQQNLPWEIRVTDVDEILEETLSKTDRIVDPFNKIFGIPGYELWNQLLQKGWTGLQFMMMFLGKLVIKTYHETSVEMFQEYWKKQQPDLVVSLVPLYNRSLWDTLQKAKPNTPVVTILTDFADCPPHFWIEPTTGSYVICGTDKAVQQAHDLGVAKERILQTSGMIIHPRFYEPMNYNRDTERQKLNLDPHKLTGLVLFGGQGSMVMLEIAKRLEHLHPQLQLIFICGKNEKLASLLQQRNSKLTQYITTFTSDIPYYMYLSDFFIGKPGPGSISEALAMQLPVIVERNAGTLIPEKYNTEWVQEKQVGLVIPSFRKIAQAVNEFLDPVVLNHYRSHVAAINNQAVFEIPQMLQKIVATNSNLR